MANGTIAFDTLQTSGQIRGTAKSVDSDYLVFGSNKCWGHFDNDSVIDDSFNTTSMTDSGTGNFLANFTNNMVDANYHADANGNISLADASNGLAAVLNHATANMGVFTSSSGALVDTNDCSYSNCGELA